jgi:hypothetical protein
MASIGSIVGGAFRLFRERPATVAIWAGIYILLGVAMPLLMRPSMEAAMASGAVEPGAGGPFAMFGWSIVLIWIGSALFYAVMICAVFRAILRPSESSFASLRLGMDELRFIGLALLLGVGLFIIALLGMLLFGVVFGGLIMATGGGAGGAILGFLLWLAVLCGCVYLWVRLSLIFPVTFVRRRMAVDEAWALTRGRFWTLFASYLVIWLITIAILMIVIWPYMAPYIEAMRQGVQNPEAIRQLQQEQMEKQLNMPLATMLLMGVVNAVISVIAQVLGTGVTASATRELLLADGEMLEDDAEGTATIFE